MYKLKHSIPLKVRLLIYHIFIQSHLNFCSIVWGFSCKSNIDSLLTVQKKAMRAVMPGYVKYYYKDGVLPTHTKPAFREYNIMTVQSIIARNGLIFMGKVLRFSSEIPQSIRNLIPPNSPSHHASHETNIDWLDTYGTAQFRNTIFFKGPLLHNDYTKSCPTIYSACHNINVYKKHVKQFLIDNQSNGNPNEWEANNNIIVNISGPRKLTRART